jgi:hypothetical protein
MTQTSYFRVQPGDRPATDLLAAGQQSRAWGREHMVDDTTTREGVSVCASREELARYLATYGQGIPFGLPGWVLVELRGDESDDQPLDAEGGELLIHPTEIVACAEIDDDMFEMIGTAYDETEV